MRRVLGRRIWAGLAGVALGLAGPVSAQAPAPADDSIVVTGQRDRAEAIRAFIEGVTVASDGQIAAFHEALCPASYGLPAAHNDVLSALIRAAGERAGIRVARPGCRPNVVVIVADNGGSLVSLLRRRRPALFAALDGRELRALADSAGPVRSWQIVEPRGADGRPMTKVSFLQIGGGAPIYIGETRQLTGVIPSLTARPTRQDLTLSLIVFDLAAIEGLSLRQLADYAAMRTLARTDPAAAPAPGRTILSLFADRAAGLVPATSLTRWDEAYLAALYMAGDTLAAAQQRSNMVRAFSRALVSGR